MSSATSNGRSLNDSRIFWGSFIALVTCAFGFVVRTQIIDTWATEFSLSETEKGNILGVGFWPFAFSIFLFSLVIDKLGYGRVALASFILHVVSTTMLVTAKSYEMLFWGTFLFALSNGTVEAYINPVVAAMYPREKTKWLNILHAGWPGGIVLAGILAIFMGDMQWQYKVALTYVPTAIYGVLLFGTRFPVSERVAAGVTYREMLQDFGALGAFVATYLVALQVFGDIIPNFEWFGETVTERIQEQRFLWSLVPSVIVAAAFGIFCGSFGRPIYFLLLLIMLPLATTELGIDSWITSLMEPAMRAEDYNPGWVLVYTALIMTLLRSFAGPIVHRMSPLGLLVISCILAIIGLNAFSRAEGLAFIFIAATIYGFGKSFFWPTMLGIVAERFPKGGALTLNTVGGCGMLGLSVGMVFLGNIQDRRVDTELLAYDKANNTALHATYIEEKPRKSVLGEYRALDQEKIKAAPEADKKQIEAVQNDAKKNALSTASIFPVIMLVAYIGLWLYFRSQGGYKAEQLVATDSAGTSPPAPAHTH